jgi:hypothetical protein
MADYNKIINIISIILILIILFIILFGCQYQRYNYYERFENNKDEEKEKKDETNLSSFEKNILKQLSDGSLKTEGLTELIKQEKFTEKNLNNIITHVEKFRGNV